MAALLSLVVIRQLRDDMKKHINTEIDGLAEALVAQARATHTREAPQRREGIFVVGSNITLIVDSVVNGEQFGNVPSGSTASDSGA